MLLSDSYHQDIQKFVQNYGFPVKRKDNVLVTLALDLAQSLFRGVELVVTDESILIGLDDNSVLALVCLGDREMGALATRRYGQTYFVAIQVYTIEYLLDLAFKIWHNSSFLSHLNSHFDNIETTINKINPLDFQKINLEHQSNFFNTLKQKTFYQCFEQAISFFWLHETAHIIEGHLDLTRSENTLKIIDEFLGAKINRNKTKKKQEDFPYIALEIRADSWALFKIFGELHKKFLYTDSLTYLEFITTTIGCTLFPLSLHEEQLRENKSNAQQLLDSGLETHPPLWFRADEVMRIENKVAEILWFSRRREDKQLEAIRFHQTHLVEVSLIALSQVDPIFGQWLGPVTERLSRQSASQRFREEADKILQPWKQKLSSCHRDFVRK